MLIYCYFNKESFVDAMKIHPTRATLARPNKGFLIR